MAIFVVYFLAYVSRWFILFLLQLSEWFLFPTFKQDSKNIFGRRLSVLALSTVRYSFLWENLSHIFDIRKSYIFADFIRISNNLSEITAYCKSLISVQIILRTRDFPPRNSLSDILSQGTSVLVTPDWLCPIASVMGASFVFIFVLTRGSINSPICHSARNKCVRPTIS